MVGGISSYMGTYYGSGVSSVSPVFDYKGARQQAKSILDSYRQSNTQVKALKEDSARFLNDYTRKMNSLNSAAQKVQGVNVNKLLYNKEGNITDDSVKATTDAVQGMVDEYNDTLKFLNDNADRGPGVAEQLYRMADDPAALEKMKMLGVSVNKDGSLSFDAAKLAEGLKNENPNQVRLLRGALSDYNGLAGGIRKDAAAGLNKPAGKLIQNDIATMQSIKADDPLRNYAAFARGSAYGMNNLAAAGMLMNMLA